MQLLSIENLSLAAEATVALLLLALAWPQKKVEPTGDAIGGEAVSWEPVKFYYLQACVHRGLYLQHWREKQNRNATTSDSSVPFTPRQFDSQENQANMPLPWQDRLTHLLNRPGLETVLREWLSIEPLHRGDSCLSMITLCKYSEMVSTQGAMVTEQAIQRFASHLSIALSGDSLVARYLPDRFVVLHFASRIAASHKIMESIQHGISEVGFFKVAGQSQSLSSIVSIVDVQGVPDVGSGMDELEDGTLEAERNDQKIVSKLKGNWTDSPPCTEPDTIDLAKPEVIAEQIPAQSGEASLPSTPSIALPIQSEAGDSKGTVANKSKVEDAEVDESIASNDISAVANADDIAALFEQINSNKASQSKVAPELASTSPMAIDSVNAPSPFETPTGAVAAELFSAKPQSLEPSKPSQETKAPKPSRLAGTGRNTSASSDDISPLFASMKPAKPTADPKPASARPLNVSAEPDTGTHPTKEPLVLNPTTANTFDLSSAASVDDIEALFDAMKK